MGTRSEWETGGGGRSLSATGEMVAISCHRFFFVVKYTQYRSYHLNHF